MAVPPRPLLIMLHVPFPAIGPAKRMEDLPSSVEAEWMPSAATLFPSAATARAAASGSAASLRPLPDLSSLSLSASEFNLLAYESLLLSSGMLLAPSSSAAPSAVAARLQQATLLNVVRVQMNVTLAQHKLMASILTTQHERQQQQQRTNTQEHMAAAKAAAPRSSRRQRSSIGSISSANNEEEDGEEEESDSEDGDNHRGNPFAAASAAVAAPATATAAAPPAAASPGLDSSMQYVNYRLNLLKCVKSSRFPSLQLYKTWFLRQLHAVWIAILHTMLEANQNQAAIKAKAKAAADADGAAAAAAASASAPACPMSLPHFKRTLQHVQLLGLMLGSKIDTKLFVLGDWPGSPADPDSDSDPDPDGENDAGGSALASGGGPHQDMMLRLLEVEATLSSLASSSSSSSSSSASSSSGGQCQLLEYPKLLTNKLYRHLVLVACVSNGDETGRPRQTKPNNQKQTKQHNNNNNRKVQGTDADDTEQEEDASDEEDDDEEEDNHLTLHSSYVSILSALGIVRARWCVDEVPHQCALLSLAMRVGYFQCLEVERRLLDADCMVEAGASGPQAEGAILPLLAHISNTLAGRLDSTGLAAAISSASSAPPSSSSAASVSSSASVSLSASGPSPSQLDDQDKLLVCYALTNIGHALSDFHAHQAGPVAIWSAPPTTSAPHQHTRPTHPPHTRVRCPGSSCNRSLAHSLAFLLSCLSFVFSSSSFCFCVCVPASNFTPMCACGWV